MLVQQREFKKTLSVQEGAVLKRLFRGTWKRDKGQKDRDSATVPHEVYQSWRKEDEPDFRRVVLCTLIKARSVLSRKREAHGNEPLLFGGGGLRWCIAKGNLSRTAKSQHFGRVKGTVSQKRRGHAGMSARLSHWSGEEGIGLPLKEKAYQNQLPRMDGRPRAQRGGPILLTLTSRSPGRAYTLTWREGCASKKRKRPSSSRLRKGDAVAVIPHRPGREGERLSWKGKESVGGGLVFRDERGKKMKARPALLEEHRTAYLHEIRFKKKKARKRRHLPN